MSMTTFSASQPDCSSLTTMSTFTINLQTTCHENVYGQATAATIVQNYVRCMLLLTVLWKICTVYSKSMTSLKQYETVGHVVHRLVHLLQCWVSLHENLQFYFIDMDSIKIIFAKKHWVCITENQFTFRIIMITMQANCNFYQIHFKW